MLLGIIIFTVSFIVVAYAETFKMFVVAMVIVTFGEMFLWPAIPTIANQLAPKGREGFYQGVVNSSATIGRMLGPIHRRGSCRFVWHANNDSFTYSTYEFRNYLQQFYMISPLKRAGYEPGSH